MNLKTKLAQLPNTPGVYFHKDKTGEIIYVGKAAVLKNRVKQYFQNSKTIDIKTQALISEISDTTWVETESEIDALFLEAEMVKRYMPRYNILLRDDKSLTFIRIDMKNEWPTVSFTRNPTDDSSQYFGPYYNGVAIKNALRYLRRVFPYYIKTPKQGEKVDLYSHLGLNPNNITSAEYKKNLRKLISYLKGNRKKILTDLNNEMEKAASKHDFESAALIRNKLRNLHEIQRKIMFGDKEFLDISKDIALSDLTDLLGLIKIPVRIEGYDISHLGGANVVASMVVFNNGTSDRSKYRKFKTRTERNDDFYNMNEIIMRRLSGKNLNDWGTPNLVLIDGGKGQLDSAIMARDQMNQSNIVFIGLAKRYEQIVIPNYMQINQEILFGMGGSLEMGKRFSLINLPKTTHVVKLLQRIRDESHRFAVSYHNTLKVAKQTASGLDEIVGIGPKTKSKLIHKFGSVRGIKTASESDIINLIGIKKGSTVIKYRKGL